MAYAFVKNILNIPNEDGSIDEFIKITTVSEFNVYEFLMKIQLLKNENFFQVNTCFSLDDIMQENIEQLYADLISIISDYTYLGDINFEIVKNYDKGSIDVELDIVLNEKIHSTNIIKQSVSIVNTKDK